MRCARAVALSAALLVLAGCAGSRAPGAAGGGDVPAGEADASAPGDAIGATAPPEAGDAAAVGAPDVRVPGSDVCRPACEGRACGPDGCGGLCGTCEAGFKCTAEGACVEACTPRASTRCVGDAVHWVDSCGNLGAVRTQCGDGTACREGVCVPCEPRSYRGCHAGRVVWVDSCNRPGEVVEECAGQTERCVDGQCAHIGILGLWTVVVDPATASVDGPAGPVDVTFAWDRFEAKVTDDGVLELVWTAGDGSVDPLAVGLHLSGQSVSAAVTLQELAGEVHVERNLYFNLVFSDDGAQSTVAGSIKEVVTVAGGPPQTVERSVSGTRAEASSP